MTDRPSQQRMGLIGVGLMGHGIATNLLRHGHALALYEHPGNQPLDALIAAGAGPRATLASLAHDSDVVLLCVTGTPQVEAVLFGDEGLLVALRPGTLVIDCSTAVPSSTERVAAAVVAAGGRFVDSPMTRTPKEAAEGRLNLLVGGDPSTVAEAMPILRCFAENITHVGPVGAGHRMKLLHNYVSLGAIALIEEAAACARRTGVSMDVFVDVLAKGGGGGAALDRVRPYLVDADASKLRFTMANAFKDLGYYDTMASEAGAPHRIAAAVAATLGTAARQDGAAFLPTLVDLLSAATAADVTAAEADATTR